MKLSYVGMPCRLRRHVLHAYHAQTSVGVWRSPEAHLHGVQGAPGSNPGTPTIELSRGQLSDSR